MFKRISGLRGKIFLGFLIVVFILIVVAFWAIINFNNLSDAINNIMVENYQSIKATESMVEAIERQDSAILMIINGQSTDGRKTFRVNEKDFYKWLARAEDNITIEGEASIIQKIGGDYALFINAFDEFFHIVDSEKWFYYTEEILPLFEKLKLEIRNLRAINQKTMVNAQERADTRANGAIISTGVISAVAIIVALLSGLYLSNQIIMPVKELKSAIIKVASRNFSQKIDVSSHDEIGELASEFNKMITKLQEYEKVNINKLVTEKEKSEAIVNNITSPIIVTDEENRIILLNQEAKKLFDINNEVENEHFLEVIRNEDLFNQIKDNSQSPRNSKEAADKNIIVTSGDKELHYKVSSKLISNQEGKIQYRVTLLENITKLKEIDQMKSDFVSTVSHEFRTPLTSMNMGLSLLLEENLGKINEEQKELLEAVYEDCERLNELVNDLLDLSRIESGKIKMEFEKTSIKNIVEATIKPFRPQAEEKGISLLNRVEDDEVLAWADSNKISWVISNLIGNALRYTESGGKIRVGAEMAGRYVNVFVEDTGVGIPREYQEKIFDKFFRARNKEDDTSGTGLGLAIAREIIEAHNGRIWVESEEGKGARFIFTLPRYRHHVEGGD
jgi:PAS domain S-box-containing protein